MEKVWRNCNNQRRQIGSMCVTYRIFATFVYNRKTVEQKITLKQGHDIDGFFGVTLDMDLDLHVVAFTSHVHITRFMLCLLLIK